MSDSLQIQIQQLQTTIAALEAQRPMLGDAFIDGAIAPLRQQLAALEAQNQLSQVEERSLITILFTDIVGNTSLAEQLDPEDWREILTQVHVVVGDSIGRHRGQVLQYLGDGLLACFGLRLSSEADPENAIRAALEAQQAVRTLAVRQPIQIRIGIHTGLVVVGELGCEAKKELTATGDAMNVAARLQSTAPPGGILISDDTYRYVRGIFDVTPQPPLMLKGKREPVLTYLIRRARMRTFHLARRGVAGIETRTVGREREIQQLQEAYCSAYEQKQVVWTQMVGEPGVGKSRLVGDLNEWLDLRPETIRLLRARAVASNSGQPFALVRSMWFDRFQIAEDAPLPLAEAKWVERFQELAGTLETEPAEAFGRLVGLPFTGGSTGGMPKDPAEVKGRAFVASRVLLRRLRQREPVAMLLEDLHWADESSWEWLTKVVLQGEVDREAKTPVQGDGGMVGREDAGLNGLWVLATARIEWHPPAQLLEYPHYLLLNLSPLPAESGRELAHELLQKVQEAPAELVQIVVKRSEGIPYYAEELVNYFLDRGILDRSSEAWRFIPARLQETLLPATLQHLLLTRVNGLSEPERAALQRGSVFGRNFWSGGLAALEVRDSETLLRPLQSRGLVEVQPVSAFEGQIEWSFHHQLLRDVTYESILKRERVELHKAAGRWLEEQARQSGRLDEFAGLLAEHADQAGESLAAASWYLKAAVQAYAYGAMQEEKRYYRRVLDLLPLEDWEQRWQALQGLWLAMANSGEIEAARTTAETLVESARARNDQMRLAAAYFMRGRIRHMAGDLVGGIPDLDQAIRLGEQTGATVFQVRALGTKALVLTEEGDTRSAIELLEQALMRARELGEVGSLLRILGWGSTIYSAAGDYTLAARLQEELAEAARRSGQQIWVAGALMYMGANYLQLGQYKRARQAAEEALRSLEMGGGDTWRSPNLIVLGEIYYFSGDFRTASRFQEEALKTTRASGDRSNQAACQNELGLILEALEDWCGAEQHYQEALEVARAINQRPREYEAVAGLAHCALVQRRLEDARRMALETWAYLQQHGVGYMAHPMRPHILCADVFDALGDGALARTVVEAGYRELMTRAEKISNPEWRESYLQSDPFNRAMVELWERTTI